LQNDLTVVRTGVNLVRVVGTNTYTSDTDRPWVFLNNMGRPESSVKVWDGINDVTNYVKVSHLQQPVQLTNAIARPHVIYSGPPSGAAKADFRQFTVLPMVGYPNKRQLEMMMLPVAAVTVDASDDDHFAIGTALKFRRFEIRIDLLARNDTELEKLTDIIRMNMARLPMVDMTDHQLLNGDGTVNTTFDYTDQFSNFARIPRPARSVNFHPDGFLTEKERYRSETIIRAEIVA